MDYIENKLINNRDYYALFRRLINTYGLKEFLNIYSYENVKKAFNNIGQRDVDYRYFVCILEKDMNYVIMENKNNSDFIIDLLNHSDYCYSLFYLVDENSFDVLLKIAKENNLYSSLKMLLSSVNTDILIGCLDKSDDEEIISLLVNNNKNVYDYFALSDRYENFLKKGLIDFRITKVNNKFITSNVIFDRLKSESIVEFRRKFDEFISLNPSIFLEEKLNKYEENIISSYDVDTGLLNIYENLSIKDFYEKLKDGDHYLYNLKSFKGNIPDDFKIISNNILNELIFDRLFKDNMYNVIYNIKELIRYYVNNDTTIVPIDRLNFYKEMAAFEHYEQNKKIAIYNMYKDKNINTLFYEDIKNSRLELMNKIKDKIYDVSSQRINDEISKKYATKIYLLDGQKFDMLIRGLSNPINQESYSYRDCYSLINQNNTSRINAKYFYGYTNFDTENVLSISEKDAFSSNYQGETKSINRLMNSDEIASYSGLSEVQLKNINNVVEVPSYIVTFNTITEDVIKESNRTGLPIVLIDEKKYNKIEYIQSDLFSENEHYILSSFDENMIKNK